MGGGLSVDKPQLFAFHWKASVAGKCNKLYTFQNKMDIPNKEPNEYVPDSHHELLVYDSVE